MIRRAFTMRLKPGGLADYKRWHDEIWPELVAEIEKQGIGQITIFEADPAVPTEAGTITARLIFEVLHWEDEFRAMAGMPRDVRPSPPSGPRA